MDAMKIRGSGTDTTASLEQASPALRTREGRNGAQVHGNGFAEIRPGQRQSENIKNTGSDPAEKKNDSGTVRTNAEAAGETKESLMDRSIISRDSDGDTLAVSRAAEEDLDESRQGRVTEKNTEKAEDSTDENRAALSEEAAKRAEQSREARIELIAEQRAAREAARERAAEEAAAERQAEVQETDGAKASEITSFAGITNDQLEQYYREGRISRNDYEQEINSREELVEAKEENSAKNAADIARLDSVKRNVEEGAEAIANANFNAGSDGMRGLERFEAARSANDQNSNDGTFENASVNVAGATGVTDTVSLRTDDGAVRAAQALNRQNTDSFLRGEERIQWDYR